MKLKKLFLAAALVCAALVSCSKEEDLGPAKVSIDKSAIEFSQTGGSQTVTLTSTVDWTVKGLEGNESWLTVSPESGKASGQPQTITISVTENTDINRSAEITFYGTILCKAALTISQTGAKGDDPTELITVKEFLTKKDSATVYRLAGVIGNISTGSSYYGFSIKDETGDVSCPFPENWTDYKADLHTGDSVTVTGKYYYYESKSQEEVEDCNIKSHKSADVSSLETLSVKAFIDKADAFSLYRLTGVISSSVNSQYCSFTLKDETGSVTVWTVNNASEWGTKLSQGDTVTLRGAYQLYNSTTHEVVDANIESYKEGVSVQKITGENLLKNGGFEDWSDDNPEFWTLGNATLAKSTDFHSGTASIEVKGASGNKRLMTDEYILLPGTYQISLFTKGKGYFRLGYNKMKNHAVDSGAYNYITDAAAADSTTWKETFTTFELTEVTSVSIVIMNSSAGKGASVFVDDVELVTKDGGIFDPQTSLSVKSLDFVKEGESKTVSLTSNVAWTLKDYNNDIKSWLTITPESGDGSKDAQTITLEASANAGTDRSATIIFDGEGASDTLTITQPGSLGAPAMSVSKESVELDETADTVTITLTSSVNWTLQGNTEEVEKWLKVTPASGNASADPQTITIVTVANPDTVRRAALTFFGNETTNATIKIAQKGEMDGKVKKTGLVMAVTSKSYVLRQGSDYTYVWANGTPGVAVGDSVKVIGVEAEKNGNPQISSPKPTVLNSGNSVSYGEPADIDSARFDNYATYLGFAKFSGVLSVSGSYYNIKVPNATKTGSLTYPVSVPDSLKGMNIDVEGYFVGFSGTNNAYSNFVATSVKKSAVQPEEEKIPEGSITLTFPDENKDVNKSKSGYEESKVWTAKIGGNEFSISAFNNNSWNNNWTFIKCGRKKGKTDPQPTTGKISTTLSNAVTKVVVTYDSYSSTYADSTMLVVSSSTASETIVVKPSAAGEVTYAIPGSIQGTGLKYELSVVCNGTGSSNGPIVISKIVYVAKKEN